MSLNLSLSGHIKIMIDDVIIYDSHNTITSTTIEYIRDCLYEVGAKDPVTVIRIEHDSGPSQKTALLSTLGTSGFIAIGSWTYADGEIENITRFSLRNNTSEVAYVVPPTFTKTMVQNLTIQWTITIS